MAWELCQRNPNSIILWKYYVAWISVEIPLEYQRKCALDFGLCKRGKKSPVGSDMSPWKCIFSLNLALRITHKALPTHSKIFPPPPPPPSPLLFFDIGVEFLPYVKWIWLFCLNSLPLSLMCWLRTEMKGLLILSSCQGNMPQLTTQLNSPYYSCIFRRQQLCLQTSPCMT